MPTYRILYTAVEYREVEVEAESESAARQWFIDDIDGAFAQSTILDDTGEFHVETIDEVT